MCYKHREDVMVVVCMGTKKDREQVPARDVICSEDYQSSSLEVFAYERALRALSNF